MKLNNHNLKMLFKKWGKHREVLPPNNNAIKNMVLAKVTPSSRATVKRSFRFVWAMSGVLCSLLVVVAAYNFLTNSLSPATSSGSVSDYSGSDYVPRTAAVSGVAGEGSGLSLGKSDFGIAEKVYNYVTESPVDDTREFMKIGYNTTIKTRDVSKLATSVQTIIRGHGGRIDNATISTKSAYISFVLPKSTYEQFKMELKDLVPERFLEENINMGNRLPQKQQIETQVQSNEEWLANLKQSRQELVASHDRSVAEIQKQIDSLNYRILVLNRDTTTSTERLAEIQKNLQSLNSQLSYQKKQLNDENSKFKSSVLNIDYSIDDANRQSQNLQKQDANLIRDVETVQGTISIHWIGIFKMLNLYVPIYWIMGGSVVVLIAYLIYGRRASFDEGLVQ